MSISQHEIPSDPFEGLIDQITAAADRVGLYSIGGLVLAEEMGGEERERPNITMAFHIGERAYSREVQDPEGVAMDAEFGAVVGSADSDFAIDSLLKLAEDLDDD